MPPSRVASVSGRTTRHSKRLASGNGEDVSPLRSLPVVSNRKASAPRANPPARRVEPPSSTDDADDSSSHLGDSRSQSIDEPESRSSSPPAERQPARRSTRNSRSASRSVSPASARPRRTAAGRTRRGAASSSTSELQAIQESPQKTLPGSFPSADPDTQLPSTERAIESTYTSTSSTTGRKRRQESSPDNVVGSVNDRSVKSKKRSRGGNYTPSQEAPSFAAKDSANQPSTSTTPIPHMSVALATSYKNSARSNTTQQPSKLEESIVGAVDAVTTPEESTGGFFSRFKHFLPKSAGAAVRTQADERLSPIRTETNMPPHIIALLESPISGPTLRSTTTPVVFPGPARPIQSEPRHSTSGAYDTYKNFRPPPLFRGLPASARQVKVGDEIVELSDPEDDDDECAGMTNMQRNRFIRDKWSSKNRAVRLENSRPLIKTTSKKPDEPSDTPSRSGSSMPISHNSLVIPATSTAEQIVLTDPKIVDLVRSVVTWTASNPQNQIPDGQQMTALLDQFNNQKSVGESAMAVSITSPSQTTTVAKTASNTLVTAANTAASVGTSSSDGATTTDEDQTTFDCVYDRLDIFSESKEDDELLMMSGALSDDAAEDAQSEVQSDIPSSPFIPSPLSDQRFPEQATPVALTTTPLRGWFSSAANVAKNVVASPLKALGFGQSTPLTPETASLIESISLAPQSSMLRDPRSPTPFAKRRAGRPGSGRKSTSASPVKSVKTTPRRPRSALKGSSVRPSSDGEEDIHRGQRSAHRVRWGKNQLYESVDSSPIKNDNGKRDYNWEGTFRAPSPESDSDGDEEEYEVEGSVDDDVLDKLPVKDSAALKLIQDLEELDPDRAYRLCRALNERIKKRKGGAAKSDNTIAEMVAQKLSAKEKYYSGSLHVQAALGHNNLGNSLSPISERSERPSMSPVKRTPRNLFTASTKSSPRSDDDSTSRSMSGNPNSPPIEYSRRIGRPGPGSFCVPEYSDDEDDDSVNDSISESINEEPTPSQSLQSANRGSNESLRPLDEGNKVAVNTSQSLQSENRDSNETLQTSNDGNEDSSSPLKERNWPQTPRPTSRCPRTPLPASIAKYQPSVPSSLRHVSVMSPIQLGELTGENLAFKAADQAPTPPTVILDEYFDTSMPNWEDL